MAVAKHAYGWIKPKSGPINKRVLKVPRPLVEGLNAPLPSEFRLPGLPPVYNQGSIGSCTSNSGAACYEYQLAMEGKSTFMPSRLFIYYNERMLEGDTSKDAGATVEDSMRVLAQYGTLKESEWPYSEPFAKKPTEKDYALALPNKVTQYAAVAQTEQAIKEAVISRHLVTFGFTVYESFESQYTAETGIMTMPQEGEQILGGHCVCIVGWSDSRQAFIVRNSWGANWGDGGYFYMPYEYALDPNLCSEFWVIDREL